MGRSVVPVDSWGARETLARNGLCRSAVVQRGGHPAMVMRTLEEVLAAIKNIGGKLGGMTNDPAAGFTTTAHQLQQLRDLLQDHWTTGQRQSFDDAGRRLMAAVQRGDQSAADGVMAEIGSIVGRTGVRAAAPTIDPVGAALAEVPAAPAAVLPKLCERFRRVAENAGPYLGDGKTRIDPASIKLLQWDDLPPGLQHDVKEDMRLSASCNGPVVVGSLYRGSKMVWTVRWVPDSIPEPEWPEVRNKPFWQRVPDKPLWTPVRIIQKVAPVGSFDDAAMTPGECELYGRRLADAYHALREQERLGAGRRGGPVEEVFIVR